MPGQTLWGPPTRPRAEAAEGPPRVRAAAALLPPRSGSPGSPGSPEAAPRQPEGAGRQAGALQREMNALFVQKLEEIRSKSPMFSTGKIRSASGLPPPRGMAWPGVPLRFCVQTAASCAPHPHFPSPPRLAPWAPSPHLTEADPRASCPWRPPCTPEGSKPPSPRGTEARLCSLRPAGPTASAGGLRPAGPPLPAFLGPRAAPNPTPAALRARLQEPRALTLHRGPLGRWPRRPQTPGRGSGMVWAALSGPSPPRLVTALRHGWGVPGPGWGEKLSQPAPLPASHPCCPSPHRPAPPLLTTLLSFLSPRCLRS